MQQPPQYNQQQPYQPPYQQPPYSPPSPYPTPQPPPIYYIQPAVTPATKDTNKGLRAMAIILLVSSMMVFIFGLCTLVFGVGILFIIMAFVMFIGGLVALAFT